MLNLKNIPAALVLNVSSRRGESLLNETVKLLNEQEIDLKEVFKVRKGKRLKNIAEKILKSGYKLVFIGGGDGTISGIVDHFAYKDIIVSILPLGTANSFAKTLQLPSDLNGAIDLIKNGEIRKIDLGQINNDYFANTANIGFPVTVALRISDKIKKYFGKFSYLLVGAYNFFSYKTFKATIKFKDKVITEKCAEIVIANGKHQGGIMIAPPAEVDSNRILIKVVKGETKWNLIKLWFFILLHRHTDLDFVDYYETEECFIETNSPKHVNIDGEISGFTPIHVKVAKNSLNIILPKPKTK